jgi:hypothetical protein
MNTKKILGIFICMLVLTMIPVTAGATTEPEPETNNIGWTTIQGILLTRPKHLNNGAVISFRCLFVHYVAQGIGQRTTGFRYLGQEMVIPSNFNGVLMNHMIMGYCVGQLEI